MTLSEALVAIYITVLILMLLLGVYFTYNDVFKSQIIYNQLSSDGVITFNNISKNIRSALSIIESKTVNSTPYTSDDDTVIIELPAIDDDDNVLFSKYDYLVYFLDPSDNSMLKIDLEANVNSKRTTSTTHLTNNVTELIFNYNNTNFNYINKVEVILVTEKISNKRTLQAIMQSTIKLRNYIE